MWLLPLKFPIFAWIVTAMMRVNLADTAREVICIILIFRAIPKPARQSRKQSAHWSCTSEALADLKRPILKVLLLHNVSTSHLQSYIKLKYVKKVGNH
jgi:hypothetical protein